jgi:hypothetical protein
LRTERYVVTIRGRCISRHRQLRSGEASGMLGAVEGRDVAMNSHDPHSSRAGGLSRPAPVALLSMLLAVAALAGCGDSQSLTPAAPGVLAAAAPAYPAESFVGRWGLGSYHRDTDKARTETIARQQCGNAYVVKAGPNGGLMMYLADDPELRELKVKGAVGGKTFIGPDGPPGGEWDREVVSFDGKVLITRWIDPELAGRYGTMVMIRCT